MEYRASQRLLQERFDTRRMADRLASVAGADLTAFRAWIQARDMFFLATADASGQPQCSYKGGDPGFVRVIDAGTLAFPVYNGNGMFLSCGNLTENPQVGLLFVDFSDGSRLRLTGHASLDPDDPLLSEFSGAELVVRVRAEAVFPNCRRYVHTHGHTERSVFVPAQGEQPPVPDWKRDPWFDGTLPRSDPALDAANLDAPATPNF